MRAGRLVALFAALFVVYIVIVTLLVVVGAVFHVGVLVAVVGGITALVIFMSPGIYIRMRQRRERAGG